MKQKLNCILLIDDDEPTNFINEIVVRQANCTKNVIAIQCARHALEFLKSNHKETYQKPDLILLDINMPGMDGWEFLEEYKNLENVQKHHITIIMLTTSLIPDDQTMAESIKEISGFKLKPLTDKMLKEILYEHFPDKI